MRFINLNSRRGERGFTLFEVLVVIAIVGIIAAVAIPNVMHFSDNSTLKAANTEAANVKSAITAYYGGHGSWPADSGQLADYLSGTIRGTYTIASGGNITDAEPGAWGAAIVWDAADQDWRLE